MTVTVATEPETGGTMSNTETSHDLDSLRRQTQHIWNHNAGFWDDFFGEGNDFHRLLVAPAAERLLQIQPGEVILEVACGNGAFSRQMAQLGARVIATDFSDVFIERARQRTTEYADRIQYLVVDASDEVQLLSLGERRFDAAVANMALMDMVAIAPVAAALTHLLKSGGRFVFTVQHPCFNSNGCTWSAELEDREGELVETYSIKIARYLDLPPGKGIGIIGQPEPHYYFHRPLGDLFGTFFQAGFALDGLEEPAFPAEAEGRNAFSWENFKGIPPVLAVRMRLMP
jgi:2-polyprenyl-3-methyl-5-hydroxy-6-metoxy-1,4-benzoquinol methylase